MFNRENLSGNVGVGSNAPVIYSYGGIDDTEEVITTLGYFDDVSNILKYGDMIFASTSDTDAVMLKVSSIVDKVVTVKIMTEDLDFNTIMTDPTGFNRDDLNTLPSIELCLSEVTEYDKNFFDGTKMINEYVDNALTFSDGVTPLKTFSFALIPTNNCYYYVKGKKILLTETVTLDIELVNGSQVIYFDADNVLQIATKPDKATVQYVIENCVIVSIFNYNYTYDELVLFAEELHGCKYPGINHAKDHFTDGCKFSSGLNISGITNNGDTFSGIAKGDAYDEDIYINVDAQLTASFLYKFGVGGDWRSTPADSKLGYQIANQVMYNHYDLATDTWDLRTIGSDYVIMHFEFTNDLRSPTKKIIGQNLYLNRGTARDYLEGEITDLNQQGLPSPENFDMYSMIIHDEDVGKIEVGADGELYVDHRKVSAAKRFS